MLDTGQRRAFDEQGFVRIPKAFAGPEAAAMEDRVWEILEERSGARRHDPSTWRGDRPSHLQSFRTNAVFRAIYGEATLGAIDDLLGAGAWPQPKHSGQFLISFPQPGREWTVPSSPWHTDFSFAEVQGDRLGGLLIFAFIADVPARGGGTPVVVGGHRLVRAFVESRPEQVKLEMKVSRRNFLDSDPWLRALAARTDTGNRIERFMEREHEIDGVPVRVAELTGEAGDVIVAHPWLLHVLAPNCGDRLRMGMAQRIRGR
ncbi:MAG: phytanoyl-CoA dioxygenase family protein [Deltaproteobacteria bacterium]|nr:phytanoyl-CoA dioxygenase family protein [Deltaproteobacteria bacterium]MBW2416195.1 phytanoyl-CoA dioxygenase family protein [Deltaproteobacteria bacterium]